MPVSVTETAPFPSVSRGEAIGPLMTERPLSRLDMAIQVATHLHEGETRDGDDPLPYITHPLEVLHNLRYIGEITEEDLLVAAVLHDTVELAGLHPHELLEWFGGEVQRLVVALTRREPTPRELTGRSKADVRALRSEYLLAGVQRMDARAQTIKLADRLSNLHEAKRTKKRKKLARYVEQTRQILRIIPREVNPPLWDAIQAELDRV